MYRYTEKDKGIIAEARKTNRGKLAKYETWKRSCIVEAVSRESQKRQIVEVSEIKAGYGQAVSHTIGGSQIYYVLQRNGWRKIMPRSKHPKKASEEVIETSKKLTPELRNWEKFSTLFVPENIELFFIPPYTPEMNPIEQIWKEIRKRGFRNEIFSSLANAIDRLCDTICSLSAEVVKSITRNDVDKAVAAAYNNA